MLMIKHTANILTIRLTVFNCTLTFMLADKNCKDLSRVKAAFKSVPLQFHFEIVGLTSAKKWQEIQNMARGTLLKPPLPC